MHIKPEVGAGCGSVLRGCGNVAAYSPGPGPAGMGQPTAMNSVTNNATDGQAKAKKTSRTNGYRAKELAEIRNSLRPFEQGDQQLRTISSLSTESSTNSVCSDGFPSVQEALQKLTLMGYDEVRLSFKSLADHTDMNKVIILPQSSYMLHFMDICSQKLYENYNYMYALIYFLAI